MDGDRLTLTTEQLRELLSYDPLTGIFVWKVKRGNIPAGHPAGSRQRGKIVIGIGRREQRRGYRAHRLAWLYVHGRWPTEDIDHINGNPWDNRLCNLREATDAQNLANMRKPSTNKSGKKGVSRKIIGKPWQAHIRHGGKSLYLGTYETVDEAHAAYVAAAKKYKGEFARAG